MSDFDEAFAEVEVIRGLEFDRYLDIDAVSNSRMKLFDKSELHYFTNPSFEATRSMNIGTMTHTALLEPSEYVVRYVPAPAGMRMDKRTKAYQGFLETVPAGCEVVSTRDFRLALEIARRIRETPTLVKFFADNCESELTIIWTDTATGLRCKCRIDKWCPGIGALDLKTTQDCTPREFAWSARKYGYFQQRAFYGRGIKAAQKAGKLAAAPDDFYFLAVETGQVLAHALYKVPEVEAFHFDSVVSDRLDTIAECTKTGIWPGPNGVSGEPLALEYPGRLCYDNDEIV